MSINIPNYNLLFYLSKKQTNKKLQVTLSLLVKKVYFLNIKFTLNNFYITITTIRGRLILLQSGGMLGLSLSKRSSNYNLEVALLKLLKYALRLNVFHFILRLNLASFKKKRFFIKLLKNFNMHILGIQVIFKKVFNGIRLKNKPRV